MPRIAFPVPTASAFPAASTVVVIGAGIVGLTAALTLAERGVPVVVLEKGRVGLEQSSRNLGWVRKMGRAAPDVPLAQASDRLWAGMAERVGADVGYRRAGIMYLARTEADMATHRDWLASVAGLSVDSELLGADGIDRLAPSGRGQWAGGLYTPSDGRAEPTIAPFAIAAAAIAKGAIVVENCAVRTLSLAAGRVCGVVTERGEIRCESVLLAGGLWSRRFLGNLGVSLPTLPLICSVLRTAPIAEPTEIAVGGPNFSFRKHPDGGFIVTQRGALVAPLTLDHLLIGVRYLGSLSGNHRSLRVRLNGHSLRDLTLARRWGASSVSPFERVRTMSPEADTAINDEALRNLAAAWPVFGGTAVEEAWAGMIDITPDSLPVIAPVATIPGLTTASGFSGHGFGTAPAAGQLAADLVCATTPIVDPTPYRLERLS